MAATIKFAGNDVALRYDFAAIARLEEETGFNVFEISKLKNFTPVLVRNLVWAGLLHKLPDLTRNEVAGQLDLNDFGALVKAVAQAITEAMKSKAKG